MIVSVTTQSARERFGQRLQRWRGEEAPDVVARALRISPGALREYEESRGETPGKPLLTVFAHHFGCRVEDLVTGTELEYLLYPSGHRLYCAYPDCRANVLYTPSQIRALLIERGEFLDPADYLPRRSSYSLRDEQGWVRRTCPACARELVKACPHCQGQILSGEDEDCAGCGNYLWVMAAYEEEREAEPWSQAATVGGKVVPIRS